MNLTHKPVDHDKRNVDKQFREERRQMKWFQDTPEREQRNTTWTTKLETSYRTMKKTYHKNIKNGLTKTRRTICYGKGNGPTTTSSKWIDWTIWNGVGLITCNDKDHLESIKYRLKTIIRKLGQKQSYDKALWEPMKQHKNDENSNVQLTSIDQPRYGGRKTKTINWITTQGLPTTGKLTDHAAPRRHGEYICNSDSVSVQLANGTNWRRRIRRIMEVKGSTPKLFKQNHEGRRNAEKGPASKRNHLKYIHILHAWCATSDHHDDVGWMKYNDKDHLESPKLRLQQSPDQSSNSPTTNCRENPWQKRDPWNVKRHMDQSWYRGLKTNKIMFQQNHAKNL